MTEDHEPPTMTGDKEAKARWATLDAPTFDEPAFTKPPPLDQATVAVVTTAALHHRDQDDFDTFAADYRVLEGSNRDYITGHWSPSVDMTGFAYDMNTIFPLDRLDELAEQGVIGAVSAKHLSYNGNQMDLSSLRLDSGPSGAKYLKEQGVGVVLLTPN